MSTWWSAVGAARHGGRRAGDLRVLSPDDFAHRPEVHGRLRRLISHRIIQNAIALYWVQVATFIVPLVTLPYVTRVLGAGGYGLVVFTQSASFIIGIFIDFGFEASMPRRAAAAREDRDALSELVASVFGARLMLIGLTVVVAAVGYVAVPKLHAHPAYLAFAWIAAVAQGLSPSWLFLGLERLRLVSLIQMGSRVLAAVCTFLLVHHRGDGWIVMALFAGGGVLSAAGSILLTYRYADLRRPRLDGAMSALRSTSTLFVGVTALSMYSAANVFILGLLATSRQVAYYAAAERLIRALIQLTAPLAFVVYPRIAYLLSAGRRDRARKLAWLSIGLLSGTGLVACLGILALASPVIRIVYGHAYLPSISVLRVLGITLVPIGIQATLSGGWMLVLHMDRAILRVAVITALVNIALAVVLVPLLHSVGMACASLGAETTVMVLCAVTIRRTERRTGEPGLLSRPRPVASLPRG